MTHNHFFTPAATGRSSEDVVLQIEAAIVSGKIRPGEGLPSERDMQTQFKTGRGVIREALRALKEKGLLEIRKGAKGGAFVRTLDVNNVGQSLALLFKMHHVGAEHIIEFREATDRTITVLAIARGDREAKQKLLQDALALQKATMQPEPDLDALDEMDRNLNLQLGRLARNPVFEWVMAATQQGFGSHDHTLYEDTEFRKHTADNWVETALHIAAGEPMKALSSIANHYVLLRQCVAQHAPNTQRSHKEEDETGTQESIAPHGDNLKYPGNIA